MITYYLIATTVPSPNYLVSLALNSFYNSVSYRLVDLRCNSIGIAVAVAVAAAVTLLSGKNSPIFTIPTSSVKKKLDTKLRFFSLGEWGWWI